MPPNRRVLLLAHPRSGSSSLYQILQLHPDLNILEEPFNEGFTSWDARNPDYLARVHDTASLDAVLDEVWTTYNGVKVLTYQLPDELIAHLVNRADCAVIFLRRRNILQAVVSVLIAHQTNVWKKWEMRQPLEAYYRDLQPLPIAEVRERVAGLRAGLARTETVVDAREDGATMKLVYEDLYYAPPEKRNQQIDAIWAMLGLAPLDPALYQQFLRPEDAKINGVATYHWLPNAREIDRMCGDDQTGWLFEQEVV